MIQAGVATPIGCLGIVEKNEHIVSLLWAAPRAAPTTPLLSEAAKQLLAYFDGDLTEFDLPLAPSGGVFQQRVCEAMCAIPFGETRTYGDLARTLNTSAQSVGQACGGNTIPIIIPCHRILGANGLGGYSGAGGIEDKSTAS
jgi:methylated-DNA-[protein]-cysteine S-methyltransferase